jgi:hypothetical protein
MQETEEAKVVVGLFHKGKDQMKPIHEEQWGRVAGGNGMIFYPGPSLPVEPPVGAVAAGATTASCALPVDPKTLGQLIPFQPEQPTWGV